MIFRITSLNLYFVFFVLHILLFNRCVVINHAKILLHLKFLEKNQIPCSSLFFFGSSAEFCVSNFEGGQKIYNTRT